MAWVHPTGKTPTSVCIVALGPSKHSLFEMTTNHHPDPELMAVDEVWGINGGVNHLCGRVAYDVLWVLDHLHGEEAREPVYTGYIRKWLKRFPHSPLITTEADGSWPDQVKFYPFIEIATAITALGGKDSVWLRNSIPMLFAYAWYIGVERIYLFGADYNHEALRHREDDKGNAEAWVHFFRMMGGRVVFPQDTTLMDVNRPYLIYGFDRQPKYADGMWKVGPSYRGVATDGGASTNPLLPPKVAEMLDSIKHREISRVEELQARADAGNRQRLAEPPRDPAVSAAPEAVSQPQTGDQASTHSRVAGRVGKRRKTAVSASPAAKRKRKANVSR